MGQAGASGVWWSLSSPARPLQPLEASGPEFSDAHMTWLNFVRRPDDGSSKKRCRGRGRDKKSVSPWAAMGPAFPGSSGGLSPGQGWLWPLLDLTFSCLSSEGSWVPRGPLGLQDPQGPPVWKSPQQPCFRSSRTC